jgi:hypothetical protein
VALDPAVNIYPWDETVVESAYEGSWVICKSQQLNVGGKTNYDVSKQEIFVGDLVQII